MSPDKTISVFVFRGADGGKVVRLQFPTMAFDILGGAVRELAKALIDVIAFPDGAIQSPEPVLFIKMPEPPVELWLYRDLTARCKAIKLIFPHLTFAANYIAFRALLEILSNALAFPDDQLVTEPVPCGNMTELTGDPMRGAPRTVIPPIPTPSAA